MTRQIRWLLCHVNAGKLTQHTNGKTRKATVRQSQISTSLPLQDTDVLPSQLLSAHTLAHTPNWLQTYTHSLPPSQTISQLHSTTLPQQSFSIVVFKPRAHCFKPREEGWAGKEDGGKKMHKSSRALRKILSSLYSMVSIRRAFDIRWVEDGHF